MSLRISTRRANESGIETLQKRQVENLRKVKASRDAAKVASALAAVKAAASSATKPDDQFAGGECRFDPERMWRKEPQVHVVPEHRGITAKGGARSRHEAAVGMALNDGEAGSQCGLIEGVRQLA